MRAELQRALNSRTFRAPTVRRSPHRAGRGQVARILALVAVECAAAIALAACLIGDAEIGCEGCHRDCGVLRSECHRHCDEFHCGGDTSEAEPGAGGSGEDGAR